MRKDLAAIKGLSDAKIDKILEAAKKVRKDFGREREQGEDVESGARRMKQWIGDSLGVRGSE